MANEQLIGEICKAMGMSDINIQGILDLYEMDMDRFDRNPNELKELFMVMIGPSKGEIAYKIYKSRINP